MASFDLRRSVLVPIFLHAHLLLAFGAAAQRWWIGELGPATNWPGMIAAGLATIAGYGYLRLVRATERDIIPSEHIHWVRANRSLMIALVGTSALVSILLSWGQQLVFGPWSLVVVGLLGLYLVPFHGADGTAIGLRGIPGLKAIIVAAGWTFVTTGLTSGAGPFEKEMAIWVAVMQFCFFLAMAIAFDIGDLKYDDARLRTIPQLVGIRWAKLIALILLIPWVWFHVVMLLISYAPIETGWREPGLDPGSLLPLIGFLATAVVIALADALRPKWFYSVLLDGMVLLIPLLGWLGGLM